MLARLVPVYRDDQEKATLLFSYLRGDGLNVKMIPDVTSPPLQSPGAHNVKSRYSLHILLVPEDEVERAEELIESYMNQSG